jgi:hypothetical protein
VSSSLERDRETSYEGRLAADPGWALNEGGKHFEERSGVSQALHKICARLEELGIAYVVVGGMSLFAHGLRRFTEDVDILVRMNDLRTIHSKLVGLGYRRVFEGSKNLRDTEFGVRIEFLIAGQYPGDGKPRPVEFPDPSRVAIERDGVKYLALPTLIELKLASGMTSSERIKDLADVQELIKICKLPRDFKTQLNPYVHEKFDELWDAALGKPKRFMMLWRNKFLTLDAKNMDDMISALRDAAATLEAMKADGVTLDPDGGTGDDYAHLITTDPTVAAKYGMHEEEEFFDPDEPDASPRTLK